MISIEEAVDIAKKQADFYGIKLDGSFLDIGYAWLIGFSEELCMSRIPGIRKKDGSVFGFFPPDHPDIDLDEADEIKYKVK